MNSIDRRTDHTLRALVALGNHLCFWAGRVPLNTAEGVELEVLLESWDNTLTKLRNERKEIEHISL